MSTDKLGSDELEYVADMLRAIAYVRKELALISPATSQELANTLAQCEAALRRAAAELASGPNSIS